MAIIEGRDYTPQIDSSIFIRLFQQWRLTFGTGPVPLLPGEPEQRLDVRRLHRRQPATAVVFRTLEPIPSNSSSQP